MRGLGGRWAIPFLPLSESDPCLSSPLRVLSGLVGRDEVLVTMNWEWEVDWRGRGRIWKRWKGKRRGKEGGEENKDRRWGWEDLSRAVGERLSVLTIEEEVRTGKKLALVLYDKRLVFRGSIA